MVPRGAVSQRTYRVTVMRSVVATSSPLTRSKWVPLVSPVADTFRRIGEQMVSGTTVCLATPLVITPG